MQVIKIEAGEYKVIKDEIEYIVSKNSFIGTWSVTIDSETLITKKTKKECLDFIEKGHSVKILDNISIVPNVEIDTHFIDKTSESKTVWTVRDIIYSTRNGKWRIKGSYYNDSIDSGSNVWDYEDFEDDCEVISDGCGRGV